MSDPFTLDTQPTYRTPAPESPNGAPITIITDAGDGPRVDTASGTIQIDLPDGDVQISFGDPEPEKKDSQFADNLAEHLTESELSVIAEKLLIGIAQDDQSRASWLQNRATGLSLLGLEIKNPQGAGGVASPVEGTSTVDHPLLLEAVLRFQANARGELLPSDGPVKVRNDGAGTATSAALAGALEKDMNHYLTKTAKEYYPDTDRMLLMLGFSGISFKKGYHDPIKRRPVIASIDAKDLIVSNASTDIDGAGRVTHRVMMRPSVLKRMQLVKAYRNVSLPLQALNPLPNPVEAKINEIQGIAPATTVEQSDQDRELYECYCEIEVPGFEHEMEGELTGLPLPYKVVIDVEARQILEIRRNWEEGDLFCLPRNRIIAYIFIPGLGFYGIGLLNILGNATKAVTAAWRLMLDAGMFSNFPGFLYLKSLAKQLTNQFRIPPGGGMPIDTVGNDIRASVMPLPYKDPSAVFIQLIENIATTAQRVGGTAETAIGEGKQDAPVGTTLALIEQSTKLMSAVHKRLHQAQGQEFEMLKSLLMEDPEALWRHNKKSKVLEYLKSQYGAPADMPTNGGPDGEDGAELRRRQMFLLALEDCDLIPAADPNTSSQTERYMKVVALRQMAQTNPAIDINKIDERAMRTMGIDDPQSMFKSVNPNQPPPPPDPRAIAAQASMIAAQARIKDSETRSQEATVKAANFQADQARKTQEQASKEKIASLGVAREMIIHRRDMDAANGVASSSDQHQDADRALAQQNTQADRMLQQQSKASDLTQGLALAHMSNQNALQQHREKLIHGVLQQGVAQQHEASEAQKDRDHAIELAKIAATAKAKNGKGVS